MKFSFVLVSLLSSPFLMTGCATIVSESKYPVALNSYPQGARVEVIDRKGITRFSGTTPATAFLDSGDGYFTRARYTAKYSSTGYSEQTIPISSSINGWYWGNIIFGGFIGMLIVDPITGAMFELDNTVLSASLSPANPPPSNGQVSQGPSSAQGNQNASTTSVNATNEITDAVNPNASPDSSARGALTTRLNELKKLKNDGVITSSEYDTKRKEAISKY